MTDAEWRCFFEICASILGVGSHDIFTSQSWCAWTTFSKLKDDLFYWRHGLPRLDDIADSYIKDGGVWGQPFLYQDIAHIIVPRSFGNEYAGSRWKYGIKVQDIDQLSDALTAANIIHRKTDLVLEIKLY